jgi:hypothetical protein
VSAGATVDLGRVFTSQERDLQLVRYQPRKMPDRTALSPAVRVTVTVTVPRAATLIGALTQAPCEKSVPMFALRAPEPLIDGYGLTATNDVPVHGIEVDAAAVSSREREAYADLVADSDWGADR